MSEWQPISTAPMDATEVRVRMKDGLMVECAHWASDLSGESQPAYRGWFVPVPDRDGRVLYYRQIDEPMEWMALSTETDRS